MAFFNKNQMIATFPNTTTTAATAATTTATMFKKTSHPDSTPFKLQKRALK
jgi:hypothetical protein